MSSTIAQHLRFTYGALPTASLAKRPEVVAVQSGDIYTLALVKGDESFLFVYDEFHVEEVLRTIARFASHHELNFTWYDAAHLSQKVRARMLDDDCGGR
jgi:hypothetical protein